MNIKILQNAEIVYEVGDETVCICPFCPVDDPDTRGHLYVNQVKGLYHCFRCGKTGRANELNKTLRVRRPLSIELLKKRIEAKLNPPKMQKLCLPEDYKLVEEGTEAYYYLRGRGVNTDVIRHYKLGYTSYDEFSRIWFPDFDDKGNLIYYTTRKYLKKDKYKNTPKYKNPSKDKYGVYKDTQIYHYHQAKKYKSIIITEGQMSAIAVGDNAVATYSMNWSHIQARKLANTSAKYFYIAYDGEDKAREKADELAFSLAASGKNSFIVNLPDEEDPASIPMDSFKECLKQRKKVDYSLRTYVGI